MGKGIITNSGADPLRKWQARINNFGSTEVSDALRTLLSGRLLVSTDGSLEVSSCSDGRPDRHRLTIRVPHAPYVADLVVTALAQESISDRDHRPSIPSPDGWIKRAPAGGDVTWELFNCLLQTLKSREN